MSYLPWEGDFPRSPKSKSVPYLRLSFAYEDENESIESLVIRGAGENQTILIDQIEAVRLHESKKRDERLMAVIDYFLKNGIDVNAKDEWGESALMNAVYSPDVVNLLLQNGANVNDKDKYGTTAMFHACVELNIGVTNALLREGAEVDADCFLSIFNEWYLNAEEMQIQLELSKLLLNRNIDVNAKDSDGKTALMLIAESGVDRDSIDYKKHLKKQIELIEFILDRGADINLQNNEGKTALIYAVKSKNKFVAEYLLEQGADANIKDNAGNTALTYAQINSVRIIGKLRKKMNVKK